MPTLQKSHTVAFTRYMFPLFAMILFLGACASTNRMMRITPFNHDEISDPERMNLWPLLYQSRDQTSALWPLFDMDGQGFALRPLAALENTSVSVLGPLAGWDWKKDIWWVTPAYKFEKNRGVFPLFGLGEKMSHIGPAYWLKEGYGEPATGLGLFPLVYYGREWGHIGPAYWLKEEPEGSTKGVGLFPLGYYGRKGGYFGTAWWSFDDREDKVKGGLFPLLTLGTRIEQLGPVFWDNDNSENTDSITVFPLFSYSKNGDGHTFISPLGGRGWSRNREARFTNILGPIFHMHWRGKERSTHVLWPVFNSKTGSNFSSIRLFPLFSREVRDSTSTTNVLWPVFRSRTRPGMKSTRIFPLYSRVEKDAATTTSALLGIFENKRDGDKQYLRLWPLFSDSNMGIHPNPPDFLTLYSILGDNGASRIQIGTGLLFAMTRDEAGETTGWNALLCALGYKKEGLSEKYHALWFLYRVKREGDKTHRDFFPFITWDTAPESSRFSFLHRVVHYERTETGRRFHLFFIPLWKS